MAIDFPNSPTTNQEFTAASSTWKWNGTTWERVLPADFIGTGIVSSATAPANTAVLWADTAAEQDLIGVPAGGATGEVLVKTSGTDYDTEWENRNLLFSHVRVLAPRSDKGYGLFVSTATVPSVSSAAASSPFTVIGNATLTSVTIESISSTAGAELVIGIYECDQQTSAPTTLLASLGSVVLSSAGLKTISGLTVALQARRIYRMAATWNGTAGSFRGTATGTTGLPTSNQYEVLLTSTTSTGVDNNTRAQGYVYTPASTGVFDISPTWSIGGAFLSVPNYGIVVS